MSPGGTVSYDGLLYALAAGAGTVGETGTGCGVGLAWLVSGARPGTRLVPSSGSPPTWPRWS